MVDVITPEQARAWLVSGEAVLVDVREPDEFSAEHIPYAISMPLSSLDEKLALLEVPEDRKILFQCLKGGRGEKACALLRGQSVCKNPAYNIAGGITSWKEAGLPVVSGASRGMPLFRQVQMAVGVILLTLVMLGLAGVGAAIVVVGMIGVALFIAGLTGWCGLAFVLSKMPWNR